MLRLHCRPTCMLRLHCRPTCMLKLLNVNVQAMSIFMLPRTHNVESTSGFLHQLVDVISWQFDYNCPIKFIFILQYSFCIIN
jgi:hypothetical protein